MAALAILLAEPDPPFAFETVCGAWQNAVQRLVLTGFMGSGKSTVGKLLAHGLGWSFADLDQVIEARLGLSVPEIFSLHGEGLFRAAEAQDLKDLLATSQVVIALGGGAPSSLAVRELLRETTQTVVIHLQAPFAVLYERCRLQALDSTATCRPLLSDEAATAMRFRERMPLYDEVAHWTADASATPREVSATILRRLAELPD